MVVASMHVYWCPWTSLNYATPERRQLLEDHRRRERRLLWEAHLFISEALDEDPEILVYFEWPHPCFGWRENPFLPYKHFLNNMGKNGTGAELMVVVMMDENQNFLRKKWLVKTHDELFYSQYRCKVCHGGHCHGRIEGLPWKMVQSIARFWAKQTVSNQQLRRMNSC